MSASASPQSDLRERILTVLRDSPKPVTLIDLANFVGVKGKKLQTELRSAFASKQLHIWSNGRSKSYWIEAQDNEVHERILTVLKESSQPISFDQLRQRIKVKEDSLRTGLETALASQRVYQWTGRSKSYWFVSQDEKAREAVLHAAAKQALSQTDLGKAAAKVQPGVSAEMAETFVSALKAEKKLQEVSSFAGRSKLFIRPGDRQAYLAAGHAFINQKLKKAGFDSEDTSVEKHSSTRPLPDAAEAILQAIHSLEPVHGVPVSTLRLRNQLKDLSKQAFDQAALALRKEQKVTLSQHVDPYNTSDEEKNLLIDGQDGTYYVAVALR